MTPKESSICGGKKDINYVWVHSRAPVQMSAKAMQYRIAKSALVRRGVNPSGAEVVKDILYMTPSNKP